MLVAGSVGFLVVLAVWWSGPGLFAGGSGTDGWVVTATVAEPVPCTEPSAVETVRFSLGGEQREAALSGCGHREGEEIKVAIPADADPVAGPGTVRIADTVEGQHSLRQPLGLLLVALSCLGGGFYASLITRAPQSRRAMHA